MRTVQQYNSDAEKGDDPEFKKGRSLFDRYYGDSTSKTNPCNAPLEKGPFYAIKMNAGDIGTKGELLTDVNARVFLTQGRSIAGLYATGNNSASPMVQTYPGAGSTLGPAMTFGYLAANHLKDNGSSVQVSVKTHKTKEEPQDVVEA